MSPKVDIPIRNIYFLLSYAWSRLEERDILAVDLDDVTELVDLFGRVLLGGVQHLRRRGIDQGYLSHEMRGATIRGRIDIENSVRENLLRHGRVCCAYDELSRNVQHNRILRSTIEAIVADPSLDRDLCRQLTETLRWFGDIEPVRLTPSAFRKVQLHRNNAIYGFLMDLCRVIMERLLASEQIGDTLFRDFFRDDESMRKLFEGFVRNFYAYELAGARVSARHLAWDGIAANDESAAVLPAMITDVTIEWTDRAIILDTKYTPRALADAHYGEGVRLRTEHLYQLYAYLRNAEKLGGKWSTCKGILLYPSTGSTTRFDFLLGGHEVAIRTVDLARQWGEIREELMAFAGCTSYELAST